MHNLKVDESSLTGESLPVEKHSEPLGLQTVLADRKNCVFSGTLATGGHAMAIVWATGDQTEFGKIAWLISEASTLETPLTRKLKEFSKKLLWIILACSLLTFIAGMLHDEDVVTLFMAVVTFAVSAIPEGLPACVTIVLAIGVNRMAKRRAIIRKLPAVETLGSTTVICTDKTGTLTENQMTVQAIYSGATLYAVTGQGFSSEGQILCNGMPITLKEHPQLALCLLAGAHSSDAEIVVKEGKYVAQGDPTEAALLVAAKKAGIEPNLKRVDTLPFESKNMYRATLYKGQLFVLGALEKLLDHCSPPLDTAKIVQTAEFLAAKGLRVLALCTKACDQIEIGNLTFLGLMGMMDPPRQEAIRAINTCQEAGIIIKMITGDHTQTAKAIGEKIGLKNVKTLTGSELEQLSPHELIHKIDHTTIFARITPEQKLKIVEALQAKGHIVAMTGDGVNDAPALKQADIGIAMGISGTDVAKASADIVLLDDNFATIEAAVEEGRGIFDNLTKFIIWTLPTNCGESLVLLFAISLGLTLPIMPVQALWINMSTAIFLGLTLAFEQKEQNLMQRPPRDPKKPILTHELFMRTGLVSLIILLGSFWLFFWEVTIEKNTLEAARTAVVNTIVAVEIAYLFNCRSLTKSPFSIGFFSNKWVLLGVFATIVAQLFFTYLPVINQLFHTAPIPLESWLRIGLVALASFIVVELEKWCRFAPKFRS